ncbi:MAG: hypothetical protein GY810_25425 [Aureispira sp.]|nr:hypothetical protein [Aureispira sp.]
MNHYLQYLRKEKRSHCTLYPNVSDHFPLELSPKGISHICLLKDLKKDPDVTIDADILTKLENSFAPNDLCIITPDWSVLLSFKSGLYGTLKIGPWFEDLMRSSYGKEIITDLYDSEDWCISAPFDLDINDYSIDTPLIRTHIFLINASLEKQDSTLDTQQPRIFEEQIRVRQLADSWEGNPVDKTKDWPKDIEPDPSYIEASWCISLEDQVLFEIPFKWCSFSEKHDLMGCEVSEPIFYSTGKTPKD